MFDAEWSDIISSQTLKGLYDAKSLSEIQLPLTEDLQKLSSYLDRNISLLLKSNSVAKLQNNNLTDLSKLTLLKIIVFNKRRGGEAARLLVSTYTNKLAWNLQPNEDIFNSLSEMEKQLVKRLEVIKTKGKRGRAVPILITPDVKAAMNLLLATRHELNITTNKYFF